MKNFLKNVFFSICLLFATNIAIAQTGLEGIEVETYYVTTSADQAAWGLPIGAKTYRVYANLQTGYSLIEMYGSPYIVGSDIDSLVFFSSTNFWNDPTNGATTANGLSNSALSTGAALIDSWLSFGSGGSNRRGILRADDTDGIATPLTSTVGGLLSAKDGRFVTGVALTPTLNGFDPDPDMLPLGILNNGTVNGNRFSTGSTLFAAGASVNAGGSVATGPDASNRVLLGQFTTAGTFGYHINLQLGTPTPGVTEFWVASSPQAGQFTMPSLILTPNTPPVVAITTPATNISVVAGTSVALEATATDAGGSIAQVEFFNGATSLFVDSSFPYQHTFTPTATANITAVATDNLGATTTSAVRTISVGANQPPVITVAAAPATVVVGGAVALTAPTLTDADGTIASVQYFYRTSVAGAGTAIGTPLTTLPFSTSWTTPATAGVYFVYGVAIDNLGATTTSANVTVTVNANVAPSISISVPAGTYTSPALITINATAADSDGTVAQVEFFVNGVSVNVDNATPFTYNWASTPGGKNFTAVATDNNGATTTSNTVAIFVIDPAGAPYRIANVSQNCVAETTCLPIVPSLALDNVIGYDVIIGYDNAKVEPTGNVIVRNNYVDSTLVEVIHSIEATAGRLNFSAYFKSNAPSNTEFNGVANNTLFCVEFAKLSTFAATDVVNFTVVKMQESYANGIVVTPADGGTFSTYKDSLFDSSLKFWADNSPIKYVAGTNLVTNIYGTDGACANKATTGVTPDANGNFVHNINKGRSISIERDIANTTSVQSVVNGFDALQVRKLLINDVTFRPSVFQILAMDVNLDGVISAGDASQINQRSVLILGEYKQAWNYLANGTPILPAQPSKDWLFLQSAITSTAPFGISTTFPNDNGVGFSKNRVPVLAFCNPTPTSDFSTCPIIGDEIYKGIMLGDVNGSYQNIVESTTLRTVEKIVFDLSKAIVNSNNTVDVPVSFASGKSIYALDFALSVNEDRMTINSTVNAVSGIQALSNYNAADKTLRFTSNSLVEYAANQSIVYVRFNTNGTINGRDFTTLDGYLNGDLVEVEVNETVSGTVESSDNLVSVFPNPTTGRIFVNSTTDVNVQLFDINGKFVTSVMNLTANQNNEINVEALNNGVYMMKVYNGTFATTKKIFVTK